MATGRYKVVPSHESMFHRWAVVAGSGTQQLYLGSEVECQNMARKFAGAFLDGAFFAMQQPAPKQEAQEPCPSCRNSDIYACTCPFPTSRNAAPQPAPVTQQAGWTNADADAARLALELECLLMDTKDTAVVSKWWQSANEALELHRARLQEVQPSPTAQAPATQQEDRSYKENEMQVWFRPARMHGHPERTPVKATITKDRGNGIVDLIFDDGVCAGNARSVPNALRLPRNVREQVAVWWEVGFEMDFQAAVENSLGKKKDATPQPAPAPLSDLLPVIKGAGVTGGYVVVTPAGWCANKAEVLRDAILSVFPVNPAYTPKPDAALAAQGGKT